MFPLRVLWEQHIVHDPAGDHRRQQARGCHEQRGYPEDGNAALIRPKVACDPYEHPQPAQASRTYVIFFGQEPAAAEATPECWCVPQLKRLASAKLLDAMRHL